MATVLNFFIRGAAAINTFPAGYVHTASAVEINTALTNMILAVGGDLSIPQIKGLSIMPVPDVLGSEAYEITDIGFLTTSGAASAVVTLQSMPNKKFIL